MAAIPTYYAMYRLVPRYLYQRRVRAFIGRVLLIVLINTVANYLLGASWYHYMTGHPIFPSAYLVIYVMLIIYSTNLAAVMLGCALRIIVSRFRMEERMQVIEQEKISTELAFLRSQINPHFLFNVLNTIYFQIHKENAEARGSVEKLSELLRYQLYECTTDKIDIERELAYIRNYVAVQQLRMEAGTDITLSIQEDIKSFKIAPLLILPLIENAFKHISHYKNPALNQLYISLGMQGNEFVMHVRNTYDELHGAKHLIAAGGLGLQNLRRRLDLLYPEAHRFEASRKNNIFETVLKIKIH